MKKKSTNVTTVTLPEGETEAFHKAMLYYQFPSMSSYFRACTKALIAHHQGKDQILLPVKFQVFKESTKAPAGLASPLYGSQQ